MWISQKCIGVSVLLMQHTMLICAFAKCRVFSKQLRFLFATTQPLFRDALWGHDLPIGNQWSTTRMREAVTVKSTKMSLLEAVGSNVCNFRMISYCLQPLNRSSTCTWSVFSCVRSTTIHYSIPRSMVWHSRVTDSSKKNLIHEYLTETQFCVSFHALCHNTGAFKRLKSIWL